MEAKINLLIAGAPKAGTTSFNNYLSQHPNIYTHFTTEFNMLADMEDFNMGIDYHINNSVHKNALNTPGKDCFVAKRVGVMYNPQLMEAIYKAYPDCKMIAVLRNPVARTFSAFKYCRTTGAEPYKNFDDAIFINDKSRFKGNKKLERNCDYVFRSNYLQHIKRMYSIFPAENIRIYLLEEIANNSTRPLNEMVSLLNLPSFAFDITKHHNEGAFTKSDFVAKIGAPGKFKAFKSLFSVEQRMKMKAFLKKMNSGKGKPEQRLLHEDTRKHLVELFKNDVQELDKVVDLPIKKYWPEFFTTA